MKILATGFMPFGGQEINPSWEAVKALEGDDIIKVCLPVEWKAGPETLCAAIAEHRPDCVLMVGQAGGREPVTIERVGFNMCDCKAPDNAGELRQGTPIREGAPDALASTFPFEEIRTALLEAGIPAEYSWNAGRYICNEVLYTALQYARENCPGMRAGFIHLPFLPEQTQDRPSMPAEKQKKAIALAVEAIRNA